MSRLATIATAGTARLSAARMIIPAIVVPRPRAGLVPDPDGHAGCAQMSNRPVRVDAGECATTGPRGVV